MEIRKINKIGYGSLYKENRLVYTNSSYLCRINIIDVMEFGKDCIIVSDDYINKEKDNLLDSYKNNLSSKTNRETISLISYKYDGLLLILGDQYFHDSSDNNYKGNEELTYEEWIMKRLLE